MGIVPLSVNSQRMRQEKDGHREESTYQNYRQRFTNLLGCVTARLFVK